MTRRNTDARLRLAERYGDPVEILRWRLRAGFVTEDAVRLASGLGDPRARVLFPHELDIDMIEHEEGERTFVAASRIVGRGRWKRMIASYVCDVAERVLPIFEVRHPDDNARDGRWNWLGNG